MATHWIQLRLPADHPVFSFPKGKRSAKLREWADLGCDIERQLGQMKADLIELKHAVQEIVNKLDNLQAIQISPPKPQDEEGGDNRLASALHKFLDF